jgi:hypothetical protein
MVGPPQEGTAMTHPPAPGADDDAVRWWQAYQLAAHDEAAALRDRAEAGDQHARLQLAGWLGDRGQTEQAIEFVRPLADTGDDVAELWLARWLAGRDEVDELRDRARAGSYHALVELAGWLAEHEHLAELRELVIGQRQLLSGWLARQHQLQLVRLAADLGDEDARRRAERWLARLRERALAGSEHARQDLAQWDDRC